MIPLIHAISPTCTCILCEIKTGIDEPDRNDLFEQLSFHRSIGRFEITIHFERDYTAIKNRAIFHILISHLLATPELSDSNFQISYRASVVALIFEQISFYRSNGRFEIIVRFFSLLLND